MTDQTIDRSNPCYTVDAALRPYIIPALRPRVVLEIVAALRLNGHLIPQPFAGADVTKVQAEAKFPSDAAAKIIGRLILCIPEKDRDYSAVFDAALWLRAHDHPGLWLQLSVRDLIEAVVREVKAP